MLKKIRLFLLNFFLILFVILNILSCKKNSSNTSTTIPPAASGQIVIDSCSGLSGVNEKCTLVTNASACTGAKCSHLVVIFSGGEMGCKNGPGYTSALQSYATNGYAAVCINYFDTATGSGDVP